MGTLEHRDLRTPDDTSTRDKTTVELVNIAAGQVGRYTFQPGSKGSCLEPVVGTDSCQVEHVGYCIGGKVHVSYADGTEADITAGEVYRIGPGHDAWVVGNEPMISVEFQGAANYAKPT